MESERSEPFVDPILRNAKRLHMLANDILDVTRIESQSLNLSKEQFNLNVLLLSIIKDRQQQIYFLKQVEMTKISSLYTTNQNWKVHYCVQAKRD